MKKKPLQRNDRIEVVWNDIVAVADWLSDEQRANTSPIKCKTLGYFFNEDDLCVRISPTINENDGDVIVIVKGCIDSIRRFV